jgi:uncharacterized protein YggU (UPF0235/DUF167 family)
MKRSLNSFHDGKTGAAITLALQYGAKATRIAKFQKDGTVNIELISVASGEKADKELMRFLAKALKVSEKNLDVLAGSSENKLISIVDISPEEVDHLLHELL